MSNLIRGTHENYHKKSSASSKLVKNNNFTYRLHIETINQYVKKEIKEILDIGCGVGTLSFYYASKGHRITGIDISQKAINASKKTAKQLNIPNSEFIRLDFPNEINLKKKFDVIIFSEVIEHIENDTLALREIYKLLKPKGVLVLSTPSITAPLHRLGLTKKFDKEVGHLRRYSPYQLKKMLRENDFKIVKIQKIEGIIRNFLFVNPAAGKLVRFIKFFLSDWVTYVDTLSLKLFGESNYIVVARKK